MPSIESQIDVLVIANKSWEAEPLCHAFLESHARPETVAVTQPGYGVDKNCKRVFGPRLQAEATVLSAVKDDAASKEAKKDVFAPVRRVARAQVWCIEDLLPAGVNSSSTSAKWKLLPQIFSEAKTLAGRDPDLVVAFGTAGIPSAIAFNGCVVVGARVLVHNGFAKKPDASDPVIRSTLHDGWNDARCDRVLDSSIIAPNRNILGKLANALPYLAALDAAEARFITEPAHPAQSPLLVVNSAIGATSTVNVLDYGDYIWADAEAQAVYRSKIQQNEIGSSETTHGLIRLAAEDALAKNPPPFMFVSGITDSSGAFDFEVTPRVYAQNFVAAHNAGIAVVWMLPQLAVLLAP